LSLRELGCDERNKIFRVYRSGEDYRSESRVEEVSRNAVEHSAVLKELGYEFADLGLHAAWLFLEEASAEQIISEVLIPKLVPELQGRVRTFSAAGATKLEPSVSEFQRLVTFIHLQPVYRERLWVRADNDDPGQQAIAKLKATFGYLDDTHCAVFSKPAFERYYPEKYQPRVEEVLAIAGKEQLRLAKQNLLLQVLSDAKTADGSDWAECAGEIIELLRSIRDSIT
jgi:hypothetical protein